MCDYESRIQKIKKSFEENHIAKMRNTSWHMPRETMKELEDELYQENVDENSEEYIEYLIICYW